ncbi:MAG TPA: acyl carrier protein [Caulobacteraceae bacterium]
MSNDELTAEVAAIIRNTFRQPQAEISRGTIALDIDGWDSLSHTTLVLDIEKHFGIRLPPDRVYELVDVGELVDLIAEVRGAR